MLKVLRVMVKILEAYGEELADNNEVDEALDVTDVQLADKALHFAIYNRMFI
jgi:hypothetical protein